MTGVPERFHRIATPLLFLITLAWCVAQLGAKSFCEGNGFLIDANYEGGNFYSCSVLGDRSAELTIRPEDDPPINKSPWYSFRVSPKGEGPISVTLRFEDGLARYWPKLSVDRKHWEPADKSTVTFTEDRKSLTIQISTAAPSISVSGQELITNTFYEEWITDLAQRDFTKTELIGCSVQGRPIHAVRTETKPEVVYLIGRQHPPEISGALAMRSFVDTVLADTELARTFRDRYSLIIIPLINPDGVAMGHWRHNMNGVDLNRDWGPFTQPETQSVARLLSAVDNSGLRPALMLDFHSTRVNVLYTQMPEESSWTIDFATVWLTNALKRLPGFEVKHGPGTNSGMANTKNYFHARYGIPSITYEVADEQDRSQLRKASPVFAEEMMRLLLKYSAEEQTSNRPAANKERGLAVAR